MAQPHQQHQRPKDDPKQAIESGEPTMTGEDKGSADLKGQKAKPEQPESGRHRAIPEQKDEDA